MIKLRPVKHCPRPEGPMNPQDVFHSAIMSVNRKSVLINPVKDNLSGFTRPHDFKGFLKELISKAMSDDG